MLVLADICQRFQLFDAGVVHWPKTRDSVRIFPLICGRPALRWMRRSHDTADSKDVPQIKNALSCLMFYQNIHYQSLPTTRSPIHFFGLLQVPCRPAPSASVSGSLATQATCQLHVLWPGADRCGRYQSRGQGKNQEKMVIYLRKIGRLMGFKAGV